MRAWLRHLTAWGSVGPAWSLPAFLGICLLLRLPAVLCADGYEYVDQQYQYVDPAWALASGQAWTPTWEWDLGMRSWVYPGFLAGVFRALLALGIEEPFALMRAVRGVHAVLSLLPLWLLWLALVRWRPVASPRLPLLLFAGSGLLVTVGVQPSGPALGATLAVAAVLAFHGPRWYPLLGGVLLGLAFCCRYQEALFGPAVLLVAAWQRRWAAGAWFALGCVPGILLEGGVDLATGNAFLGAPWAYFRENVLHGRASGWRTQPFWFYFAAGVVPVAVLLPPWWRVAVRRLAAGARVLPAAAAAAALHLVAHSFVARKALRFEYGALALLLAVVAAGLGVAATRQRWAPSHRAALCAVHGLLFVCASFFFAHAGTIGAADRLRREPAFDGDLLVVNGDATSVGGAYYLRRDRLRIVPVTADELAASLRRGDDVAAEYVVAVREPLSSEQQEAAGIRLLGRFTGLFDLRRGDRRFLYGLRR